MHKPFAMVDHGLCNGETARVKVPLLLESMRFSIFRFQAGHRGAPWAVRQPGSGTGRGTQVLGRPRVRAQGHLFRPPRKFCL
jgi:hypothetical protein